MENREFGELLFLAESVSCLISGGSQSQLHVVAIPVPVTPTASYSRMKLIGRLTP